MLTTKSLTSCCWHLLGVLMALVIGAAPATAQGTNCVPKVVCVGQIEGDGAMLFYLQKLTPGTITMRIEVSGENISTTASMPYVRTLDDTSRVQAFVVTPKDGIGALNYEYSYQAQYGRPDATHKDAYRYALPYEPGTAHPVAQAYDSEGTHRGIYAIDWTMPVGTPVHAAREGLVVAVRDTMQGSGITRFMQGRSNFVFVQHSDGTIGVYGHLQQHSAAVAVGDSVRRGQLLARSGNTGYSTGPHLHFEVFRLNNELLPVTLPVRFDVKDAPPWGLTPGRRYRIATP